MITQATHTIERGVPWERLVIVKSRRTHRIIQPTDAWATMTTGSNTKQDIPCTLTREGGIMLSFTADETADLPLGTWDFDVVAVVNQRSVLDASGWVTNTKPVAKGTLEVVDLNLVSPLTDPTP